MVGDRKYVDQFLEERNAMYEDIKVIAKEGNKAILDLTFIVNTTVKWTRKSTKCQPTQTPLFLKMLFFAQSSKWQS